ncbi:MAG: glutamine-hydrolyzing carbamoyl-phosphate synthase small subunit [Bacteroidota bacterium]
MQTKYIEKKSAVLLLQDGTVFYGKAAGKIGTATGEICFNTGMTGYQEIFTDPSYTGQLMVMASTHIGNYGVNANETESGGIKISGLVCKNFSAMHSRKLADASLQDYLEQNNTVAISDVDTRAIVRHIRNKGAMNAIISSEVTDVSALKALLQNVPSMEGLELSSKVSTKEPYFYGDSNAKYKVAAIDFGIKTNILRCLANEDCYVKVFPYNASFASIKEFNADGYFLSNGPGDPAALPEELNTIKDILNSGKPVFGICLGHQLIALASGISTYKMHNGHRGINHPVKNLITGKCEVTSQNHGFAVNENDVKNNTEIEVTHVNLNDNTIEGIRYKNKPIFCVQYHPEASPGPHDSRYLFADFVKLMKK